MRAELQRRIDELEEEYRGRSEWAKGLAQGPMRSSLADMERRYGIDLDARSHGQEFLQLFESRFVPDGLYLAFPGARILSFDDSPVTEVPCAELSHVQLTRDFLAAPECYLRHLG